MVSEEAMERLRKHAPEVHWVATREERIESINALNEESAVRFRMQWLEQQIYRNTKELEQLKKQHAKSKAD